MEEPLYLTGTQATSCVHCVSCTACVGCTACAEVDVGSALAAALATTGFLSLGA